MYCWPDSPAGILRTVTPPIVRTPGTEKSGASVGLVGTMGFPGCLVDPVLRETWLKSAEVMRTVAMLISSVGLGCGRADSADRIWASSSPVSGSVQYVLSAPTILRRMFAGLPARTRRDVGS